VKLPKYVSDAILCGSIPKLRDWQHLPIEELSMGEKVLRFAADLLVFPEGIKIGQPLILDPFQQAFIICAMEEDIRKAILSMARRGGKTLLMAVILLYFMLSADAKRNTIIRSAAMTREQAGLIYRMMNLICQLSPLIAEGVHYRSVPSSKKLVGLRKNVEYQSLSRDAKSGHGQGIYVLVLDECGQIVAEHDDFLDMLFSSLGTYEDSKSFLISTQAPTDRAFLSLEIDAAARDKPKGVVCHLYTAPTEDILDKKNWNAANPSLRTGYRDIHDIERGAHEAERIPAKQNGFLNLFLNRRVSLESVWLAPSVWRAGNREPVMQVFRDKGVHMGLDLSAKNDLTCAVISAEDDFGNVHLKCYTFVPVGGIDERERRDKLPHTTWVMQDVIHAFPGNVVSYDMVCEYLRDEFEREGIHVLTIQFDRWKITELQSSAERTRFAVDAEWVEVGQGFVGFSPRMDTFETKLLEGKVCHGNAPILNLGASSAVVDIDPAGNKKLTKKKSTHKIDGLVAAVMAVHPWAHNAEQFDAAAIIG
jgi:phage terminase large subunit-like protein